MNVDDSVRMALSEATRSASVGSVSEVTAELGSLGGADASGGASISSPSSSRPTLSPCFKCEYDVTEERYVIREPKVIVPGQDKPIEPEDPGKLSKNKTYVCAITRENNEVKAEIVEEDNVPDDALVSVPICKIDDSRGFDIIIQYHVGAIVLGGATFVGDMDGSEAIGGAGEEILVTGHSGEEGSSGKDSHSGIQFLTVSGRGDGGEKLPAKIIARIKNKDENEDWAAKTMTVPISGGGTKIVHFLGCDDVDLSESEDKNDYFADERSLTLCGKESTDPTQIFKTNYFHIYGFGKFTANEYAEPIGTYREASVLEIGPESTDASSVAFLVREGNSKEPDSNFLGYRKIKFGTGSRLSPFQYVEERRPAEEGEFGADEGASVLVSAKLVQCVFYWEGQLKQLPEFDVSGILGGGTVYLTGKQEKPSASSPNPEWTWVIATAEAQAPDGGKVLNFRLYEFADQKVKIDYRTTFLSLEDTTQKAYYQLKTANGAAKITLDATGASPKIEIEGEDGKKITLDVGAFPSDCKTNALAIRSFKYTDKDGKQQIYHGLFCSDIDLGEINGGGSDVEIKGGTGIKVTETTTGDKVSATVSNTGVIGLVGQDSSQAANGTITTKAANGSGLKVTVTRTAEPTEQAPLSNGTLEVDIDGRDKNDTFGIHTMTVKGAKDEDDQTVRFLATEDIEIDPKVDDSPCVKKDKTPADNRFDGGKGVSFGSEESKFSLSANLSNLALTLDHTTGQVFSIPADINSTIAIKRRDVVVQDSGSPTVGSTYIGYGSLALKCLGAKMPYVSFKNGDTNLGSIQPHSGTRTLYINSADFGIALNGKQNNVKCLTTPTATLENAANDLNIANLKWISSQLKPLKLNDTDTNVKILATNNVNIKQKQLVSGTGIKLTKANGKITISATGANTSGFTGSRTVLADTQYSGHYLQKRFYTETWKDGVLESSTLGNWITYHTAVEETA